MDLKESFYLATYRGKLPMKGSSVAAGPSPVKSKGGAGKGTTKPNMMTGGKKPKGTSRPNIVMYHATKGRKGI